MKEAPWGSAFERYLEHRRRRGTSAARIQVDRCTLRRLLAFCRWARVPEPQAFTPQKVDAFARYLQTTYRCPQPFRAHPLSPATILDTFIVVRGFFAFLVREGDLLLDPLRFFRMRRPSQTCVLDRAIDPKQMTLLAAALKEQDSLRAWRDWAVLEVLFGCGLRKAEVAGLDLGDVSLDAGLVRVRYAKGGHERLVPIAGTARRALRHYLEKVRPQLVTARSGPAVFLAAQGGRPLMKSTIYDIVRRAGEATKLPKRITTHMFRHGYATSLIRGGASVRVVQALLGHRRIASTQVYTAVVPDDLARVHSRTHPRETSS